MGGAIGVRVDEVPHACTELPRVGVVSAWFDPEEPKVWSGVPHGLVAELRRLGVYGGHRNITPWATPSRVLLGWIAITGRDDAMPTLQPEMRLLAMAHDAARRATARVSVDGWVHLGGGFGRAVRGRYVTLFDMSPSQLLATSRKEAASLGYPGATPRQMQWVVRRQVGVNRHAFACCVPSRWAADSLVRDHGVPAGKVHVVGYGRNADIPPPSDRDWSTPRFLFVGRGWERKNGDAVVRAFLRLRREVPRARLDVVGDHPPLDIEGVTGHGVVSVHEDRGRGRIEELFSTATCFVLPSLVEPFGIVYVEAAAAGLPSIGTTVGGTGDSVGPGGVLVDPFDDDAICRAMRGLCDPDTARSLGEVACQRSASFTWPKFGQRVLKSLDLVPIPNVELAEFL